MQQFNFWATELAIGCDLLRKRYDAETQTDAYNLSSLRLRLGVRASASSHSPCCSFIMAVSRGAESRCCPQYHET
eukprot:4280675-Amphidinium_carterae.1